MTHPTHSESHWYCEVCGGFDGPKSGDDCDVCWDGDVHSEVEYMVPAGERDELVKALREIDHLAVKWDAPLKHEIGGDQGEAAWAVVGSEASMIAHLALGGSRQSARARLKETR